MRFAHKGEDDLCCARLCRAANRSGALARVASLPIYRLYRQGLWPGVGFVKEFNGMDRRAAARGQDTMPNERNTQWLK
ncbi:MAG: hypothetical protein BGN82_08505 [Alphaproteobacteria bacterium 65-7]|nr:MAG: hypothetical protein BGN82_08505 [Alphaproteobacteria bacterium 65-7]